jgi:hypothetical protein
MAAPPKAVLTGSGGRTTVFVDTLSAQVSAFLLANTVMDVQDGTVPHIHLYTGFGLPDDLASQIVSALQATGLFNVAGSVLPIWFQSFSSALLLHLQANADMVISSGAGHVHLLL